MLISNLLSVGKGNVRIKNRLYDNDIHIFVFVLFVVSDSSENCEETFKIIA